MLNICQLGLYYLSVFISFIYGQFIFIADFRGSFSVILRLLNSASAEVAGLFELRVPKLAHLICTLPNC